ncbi:MAG: hypothetical protein KF796_13725 [Ramlibacter sp.]|nr:hypothetical protein [Ramlibacter sp.]
MATAKKPTPSPVKAPVQPAAAPAVKAPVAKAPAPKAPAKKAKAIAPKPATKPAAKPAATPKATQPKAAKPVKPEKPKKPKLVRDSFTIPKAEFTVLDDLKQRAAKLGTPAKKSELLRAGIKALAAMSDVAFKAALSAVPAIKTGRPKSA